MSLATKTQKWLDNGLISAEQRNKILAFERQKSNGTFWHIAFILAGLLIGLGICLVIAANWKVLPGAVKLTGDFILLGALIYGVYWSQERGRTGLKEVFAIVSFLMIGATIGLVGQVFHLSGGWHDFALGWAVLGAVFVLASRAVFFNMGWIVLLLSLIDGKLWEKLATHLVKYLDGYTFGIIIGLVLIHYGAEKLYHYVSEKFVLPKALAKLAMWAAYISVTFVGVRWGLIDWKNSWDKMLLAYLAVFGFLAFRMYQAVRAQNVTSFKRNAILAQIYIFGIFASRFGNLFLSGLGFIAGGLLVLLLIYSLKKTTGYIKQMEVFK